MTNQTMKAVQIKSVEGLDFGYTITENGEIFKQPKGLQLKEFSTGDYINPYKAVRLRVGGDYEVFSVAQLVYNNFVGEGCVYHKDNNFENNHLDNLASDSYANVQARRLDHANSTVKTELVDLMSETDMPVEWVDIATAISGAWLNNWLEGTVHFDADKLITLESFIERVQLLEDAPTLKDMVDLADKSHYTGVTLKK